MPAMAFPLDSASVTHGIQLAVAPVFLLTAVSGMIGAVAVSYTHLTLPTNREV